MKEYNKPILELVDINSSTRIALELSTNQTLNFDTNPGESKSWVDFMN